MKKRIIVITMFLVITSVFITEIIFFTLKTTDEKEDIQAEIQYLNTILSREYENEEELLKRIDDYSNSFQFGVEIIDNKNNIKKFNIQNKNIFLEEELINVNSFNKMKLYFYDRDNNNILIKNSLNAIIISIVIALFFINRFVIDDEKNNKDLILNMKKIALGETPNLSLKGKDEKTRQLESSFNEMNKVINENIEEYKKLNIKLSSIISSMNEGILAVDNDYNKIFNNELARYILEFDNINSLTEIKDEEIREGFIKLIENKDIKGIYIDKEYPFYKNLKIKHNDIRDYQYSNRKIGDLFIIEDITEIKHLQTMQKDFVTNISHELKTPMTSILGFIETILEDDFSNIELSRRFLNIVDEEIQKMNELLNDLLLLSEIETIDYKIEYEIIDLNELIESIFLTLEHKAKLRDIDLELNFKDDNVFVLSNYNFLRQILMNLVDNSIKYNKEGGYVVLTVSAFKNELFIDVLDNGIGIDEKEKERIFERFYRIDKSRANTIEGTGLGLSIVRHLVSLLRGSIHINSKKNIGTITTVKLPIRKNR